MIGVLVWDSAGEREADVPMEDGFSSLIRVQQVLTHDTIQEGGFADIGIPHNCQVIDHILKGLFEGLGETLTIWHTQSFVHSFDCKDSAVNLCLARIYFF